MDNERGDTNQFTEGGASWCGVRNKDGRIIDTEPSAMSPSVSCGKAPLTRSS